MKGLCSTFSGVDSSGPSTGTPQKVIGLLGGLGWPSTVTVYETINRVANERLGGTNTAQILMNSVNLGVIMPMIEREDWESTGRYLGEQAQILEKAGPDFVMMPCNTPHRCAPDIEDHLSVPFIHIADSVGRAIQNEGVPKVLLLGSKYTMQLPFYRDRLRKDFGVEVITPSEQDQEGINAVIMQELVRGDIRDSSKAFYLDVIDRGIKQGVEGVILGCTEIGLLVQQADRPDFPMFDTTIIHSLRALDIALGMEVLEPKGKIDFRPRLEGRVYSFVK